MNVSVPVTSNVGEGELNLLPGCVVQSQQGTTAVVWGGVQSLLDSGSTVWSCFDVRPFLYHFLCIVYLFYMQITMGIYIPIYQCIHMSEIKVCYLLLVGAACRLEGPWLESWSRHCTVAAWVCGGHQVHLLWGSIKVNGVNVSTAFTLTTPNNLLSPFPLRVRALHHLVPAYENEQTPNNNHLKGTVIFYVGGHTYRDGICGRDSATTVSVRRMILTSPIRTSYNFDPPPTALHLHVLTSC